MSGIVPLHTVFICIYMYIRTYIRMYIHPVGEGGICGLSEALLH